MKRTLFIVFALLTLNLAKAQGNLSPMHLQEKIYLQTDKPYYYPGENVWFSGYINHHSKGLIDTLSQVVYVDLINSNREIIQSLIIKADSGTLIGNLRIPYASLPGAFLIRAYTNWMRNYGGESFFYKSIPVLRFEENVTDKAPSPVSSDELDIVVDKKEYHSKEKVIIKLALKRQNVPIEANLSLSVIDEIQVVPVPGSRTITRDYILTDEIPPGILSKFIYPVERGVDIDGVYTDKKGQRVKAQLTIIQENFENLYMVPTNDDGSFNLKDLQFYDSTRFAIQSGKGKVILKPRDQPLVSKVTPYELSVTHLNEVPQRFLYDTGKLIVLKAVEVKSNRLNPEAKNRYMRPDVLLRGANISGYLSVAEAIQSKVPGYQLIFSDMHWKLIWLRSEHGKSPPMEPIVYINNSQVQVGAFAGGETIGDRLSLLDVSLIDRIEAGSGANTSIGGLGSVGMIFIYTKDGNLSTFKSLPIFKVKGFDRPASFKSPDYENPTVSKTVEDYRSTIYWNPKIHLSNHHAPVELSFFTADLPGTYRIIIEGITTEGKPFHCESRIEVTE